jgi:hypothetical protein
MSKIATAAIVLALTILGSAGVSELRRHTPVATFHCHAIGAPQASCLKVQRG